MKDTIKVDNKNVRMVAHRGLSGLERENSCAAFIAAGNRSVYYGIETDVHRTKDGKYVVIHDSDTGRVSATNINIEQSTFAEVRSVILTDMDGANTRADLRIPTLQEYVKICKKYGKVGVLELKTCYIKEHIQEIIDIIKQEEYLDHIVFISFALSNLVLLREILPDQPAQWLTGDWKDEYYQYLDDNNLGLDIWYGNLTEETIQTLKAKKHDINIWTCDDPAAAEKYIALGVDYITSNILE